MVTQLHMNGEHTIRGKKPRWRRQFHVALMSGAVKPVLLPPNLATRARWSVIASMLQCQPMVKGNGWILQTISKRGKGNWRRHFTQHAPVARVGGNRTSLIAPDIKATRNCLLHLGFLPLIVCSPFMWSCVRYIYNNNMQCCIFNLPYISPPDDVHLCELFASHAEETSNVHFVLFCVCVCRWSAWTC